MYDYGEKRGIWGSWGAMRKPSAVSLLKCCIFLRYSVGGEKTKNDDVF